MEIKDIEKHWKDWATQFGEDIRATEKSKTRKALEVDALVRAIKVAGFQSSQNFKVLEAGSGTGHNCIAVAETFPSAVIHGFDFIPEMVANAESLKKTLGLNNITYSCQDLLKIDQSPLAKERFDIVFTNRCLINLNSHELQQTAVNHLCKLVSENGIMILAENPQKKFDRQNYLRSMLNLPARVPPDFNLLINEDNFIKTVTDNGLELVYKDDFSSLHDILLYVLIPSINGGIIDYDHPILEASTKLGLKAFQEERNAFADFGQNRMFYFARRNR
jgi:SAM-dependent methyltransferase